MFHSPRPPNRNTRQTDSLGMGFSRGKGSYMHEHRLHHGFESPREWERNHHPQGGEGQGSQFFRRHTPIDPHQLVQVPEQSQSSATHAGRGPKNFQRTDARIHEEICERLMHNPHIDASEIEVEVKGGKVTLKGHVPHRIMKWRAEDIAEAVGGVKEVSCQVKVDALWKNMFSHGKDDQQGSEKEEQRRK
ncbi:MAG: BON domain-containing protein [Bdellovibrionota bacterium]